MVAAEHTPSKDPPGRSLAAGALLVAAGLILLFWRLHADDNDASLYVLIGRRLAVDGTPFTLWFPPAMGVPRRPFFEHPPLFFWMEALALRVSPTFDLRLLGAAFGLITVASTFVLGRALLGARAAFLGCVVLVATDSFSDYQPLARLDPPLTAAFTASVALIVTSRGRWTRVLAGGLVAGLGALVKGPPALGAPVVAAALLAASGDRRSLARASCWVAGLVGASVLPVTFLLYDRLALNGTWWSGYVLGQVYESAMGTRRHQLGPWPLVATFVGRFWPGLPLAAIALVRAGLGRRSGLSEASRAVRCTLLGWAVLVYLGFVGRRYWFYLMPAYPGMALLAGAGAEDLVGSVHAAVMTRWTWRIANVAGSLALLVALLPVSKLRQPFDRPCRFGDLPGRARALAAGRTVAVVPTDYSTRVIFAEHCACAAVAVSGFEEAERRGDVAIVFAERGAALARGWREIASHGTWALYGR